MVVAKFRKVNLSYKQAYKLGLYLVALPVIYSVLTIGPLSILSVPFGFTIILALVTYINLIPTEVISSNEKIVDITEIAKEAKVVENTSSIEEIK